MEEALSAEDPLREELAEIRRAVEIARRDRAIHGDIYVLWGMIVALGTVIEAIGLDQGVEHPWVVWPVLGALGGIYSTIAGFRRERSTQILTHVGKVEAQTWLAATIAVVIVSFVGGISGRVPSELITPLISVILGVPMRTAGTLYDSRYLRVSSLGFFACGAVSLFLDRPYPQILFTIMMLIGYVWPGLMMIRAERQRG